ncbi:LysR family transcriptional regulator [Frateuria aurantia]
MSEVRRPGRKPAVAAPSSAAATSETPLRFYYKGSRYKQLRAFVYTVKSGSLSRASEALFLSQPSVSLQLQALERELGVALLERRRRRIQLTEAGEILYELARPLIEGWETLDRRFEARVQGLKAGRLTVVAGASTLQYLLPRFVSRFRERYPDVQLQLVSMTEREGMAMLRNDRADVLVGSMLDVPADLSWAPVFHYDPMLVTPPGHPLLSRQVLTLGDLSDHGLILPPDRQATYRLVDLIFQQQQVPYHVAIEIGGWEAIKQYVALGMGITIMPGLCVTEADQGRLGIRNIRQLLPQRSYGVGLRRGKFLSTEARNFVDLLRPGLSTTREYDQAGASER